MRFTARPIGTSVVSVFRRCSITNTRFWWRGSIENSERKKRFSFLRTPWQRAVLSSTMNLMDGAFYHHEPEKLISSLQENLAPGRIEVDLIKFSGPAFPRVDNRLMS